MEPDQIKLIFASAAAVITFIVSLNVLKQVEILSNPVISIVVSILTFLGISQIDDEILNPILALYAALGLSLLFLLLIFPLLQKSREKLSKFYKGEDQFSKRNMANWNDKRVREKKEFRIDGE